MTTPSTLRREVSPPPVRRAHTAQTTSPEDSGDRVQAGRGDKSEAAAIEAGDTEIRDHLNYFLHHFSSVSKKTSDLPRISLPDFKNLYQRNRHAHGTHFVVHQHNHPISGTHYDLRLQFSETSTLSFAIPYGLPGSPNSARPSRMAIETRVHNLWNNLIESASHATGSLLIWDTGEYEVLPRRNPKPQKMTDDEMSDIEQADDYLSQSEKLVTAFHARHIRLRLHGTRLPSNYTIAMRLPSANDKAGQPNKPKRKRRRLNPAELRSNHAPTSSKDESEGTTTTIESGELPEDAHLEAAVASEDEEDSTIRANNAYTGASNTIGSIHQRNWFLTLDRSYSGFQKARSGPDIGRWVGNWKSFFVLGRDQERSVVTGRLSDDVLRDEGVENFVERKMWRPIME